MTTRGERPGAVYALGLYTWRSIEHRRLRWAAARLMHAVLESDRFDRILVVDPWRSAAVLGKRLLERGTPSLPTSERVQQYMPLRLRRRDPTSIAGVERSYQSWDARVRRAAGRAGLHEPVVITNDPLVAGFAPLEWAGSITLYATDDLAAYPPLQPWWPALHEAYARTAIRGHGVCAVSAALLERIGPTGPGLVVPNGVDPADWLRPAEAPAWFDALPRPRLLYTGTLDRRIDVQCVRGAAEAYGNGSIVLLGERLDREHLAPVLALPNVVAHPAVGPQELAAVVRAADAGLVPHVRTRLTEAMSPLKLYEFLAGGLPVAAVDLPPLRGVSDRIALAAGPADFPDAVRRAVESGPAREPERVAFIERNAWSRRHQAIIELATR